MRWGGFFRWMHCLQPEIIIKGVNIVSRVQSFKLFLHAESPDQEIHCLLRQTPLQAAEHICRALSLAGNKMGEQFEQLFSIRGSISHKLHHQGFAATLHNLDVGVGEVSVGETEADLIPPGDQLAVLGHHDYPQKFEAKAAIVD